MQHFVPYLILILICIPLLIWIVVRKRSLGLLTVFFAFVGMIYVFEYFILVVFECYFYKPHFLAIPYYDNIMGALISDLIAVPVIALLVAAFQLRFVWIVLLTLTFGGIEWLFVRFGIYQLYWWKIGYTIVIFTLFFCMTRWWYKKIMERYHPLLHFFSLFFGSFVLITTFLFATGVLHWHIDHTGLFQDPYRDSVFASIYGVVEALVLVLVQYFRRRNLWWNALFPIVCLLFEWLLVQVHVIRIQIAPFWFYFSKALFCVILLVFVFFLNEWLLRLMPQKTKT